MGMAARRSYRVLTVSEASKRDILRLFDISSHKVEVVPNAIEDHFWRQPPEAELARVRAEYGLERAVHPVRRQPQAAQERGAARGGLRAAPSARRRRRVAGGGRRRCLRASSHPGGHPPPRPGRSTSASLGYVADPTLAILYRLASVFAFPSLYEGFGLPVAEAMACGTPVVASNVSSVPEVAADAALLVDPLDVDAIADGLARVLTDEAFASALRARGPVRARRFSWERSVRRVRQIYGAWPRVGERSCHS